MFCLAVHPEHCIITFLLKVLWSYILYLNSWPILTQCFYSVWGLRRHSLFCMFMLHICSGTVFFSTEFELIYSLADNELVIFVWPISLFFCLFVCFLMTFDCRLHNCSTWVELLCSMWNLPSESESVTQSCPTVCDSMAWILQARILEWVAIPFSRGSTWPRNQTGVSCIAGRFFTNWVIREASIFPDHGSNWRPPVMAGEFLSTTPTGKSHFSVLFCLIGISLSISFILDYKIQK